MSKSKHTELMLLLVLPGMFALNGGHAIAQGAQLPVQLAAEVPNPADADDEKAKAKKNEPGQNNQGPNIQNQKQQGEKARPNGDVKQPVQKQGQKIPNDRPAGKAAGADQQAPRKAQAPDRTNQPERAQREQDGNQQRDPAKAERNNKDAKPAPVQALTPPTKTPPAAETPPVAQKPAAPADAPIAPKADKIETIAPPANKSAETPPPVGTTKSGQTPPDAAGETKPPAEAKRNPDGKARPDDRANAPGDLPNATKAAKDDPVASRPTTAVAKETFVAPPKPAQTFEQIKKERTEKVSDDGKTRVIREVDKRVIIKQDNRVIIRNDESERFRRVARNATTSNRSDGSVETVYVRGDGVRVYNVVDREGRILYRYRRDRENRDVIIIDNRHFYRDDRDERRDRNRNLAIGVGVGIFVGAAIVALAPPVITIPREKYIVDYSRASEEDLYEALTAPPVERLERSYSLEEIRYNAPLRERMRRVDIDTVTFDFGSWEVEPNQYDALAQIGNVINRALDRNANEVFLIEGHTDAVGSDDDNLTLSDRRAQAVAEILTSRFNVPPENIVTQGYGEEQLKVRTEQPERENRRIAFRRVTPLLSDNTQTQ